jgi:hypothetical protein
MRLFITAPRLSIERGTLELLVRDGRPLPLGNSTSIVAGVVEGLPTPVIGEAVLTLSNCTVRSATSGSGRHIALCFVPVVLKAVDDRLAAEVSPCAFLQVVLPPLATSPNDLEGGEETVGIATVHGTIECLVRAGSSVNLLLPAGEHTAYVVTRPQIRQQFEIPDDTDDAGLLVLNGR